MDKDTSEGRFPVPDPRVTTEEREAAVENLQAAYTRGQLEESELDDRIKRTLTAKVRSELLGLLADLPAPLSDAPPSPRRFAARSWANLTAHGSAVHRTGAWSVPPVLRSFVYKGSMVLDLRQAVLESPDPIFKVIAYKGVVEIIVPRGYRIQMQGSAYKGHWDDLTEGAASDAPLITLKGFAYKGSLVVRNGEKP
jgi:hypothetical protein